MAVGAFLAYANGANDNFKGVATLFGSGSASFRRALAWATVTTALGSVTALFLARGLIESFSGKGLVTPEVLSDPSFPIAVALAAATTVFLATRLGLPVSTTHALIGGLVGAGLSTSAGIDGARLSNTFLLPLLTSPFLAVVLAGGLYLPLRAMRRRLGISQETCVCVGTRIVAVVPGDPGAQSVLSSVGLPTLTTGTRASCRVRYRGSVMGIGARPLLDSAHYLSAGAVSFARGLNDTPKIAALMLVGGTLSSSLAVACVGAVMAVGGLVSARRVADTMSKRVTDMNPGQGFTANVVTSLLVIGASRLGLPVSTTHVSCGSLFGIGTVTRRARWRTIAGILLAWIITLPMAALLAAVLLRLLGGLIGSP